MLQSCLKERNQGRNSRGLTMGRGSEVGKDTASPAMRKETLHKTTQGRLQADTGTSLVMFPFMLKKGTIHTAPHCSYIMWTGWHMPSSTQQWRRGRWCWPIWEHLEPLETQQSGYYTSHKEQSGELTISDMLIFLHFDACHIFENGNSSWLLMVLILISPTCDIP